MSTTLLQELQGELRRLYIAGSDLAADDFRLKRLEPKLEQLGERAPVFKKLAEGVAALTGPSEPEARAVRLQDVSLLLNSVLSTQGATAAETQVVTEREKDNELPELTTMHSYRQLAEVQNALSESGGGRYEIVTSAYEQGLFRDLRLFPFAMKALGDSYSEIADFAARNILPSYGRAIVPYLLSEMDIQGGREEERRLQVVRELGVDPDDAQSLKRLVHAAEEGADKIRSAAIACLGPHPAYEERLLEWSQDKKKAVREGALRALAVCNSEAARDRLYDAFKGKDALLAAEAIGYAPSAEMIDMLLPLFEERLRKEDAGEVDKKAKEKQWSELEPFLTAFEYARHPDLERLYLDLAGNQSAYPALGRLHGGDCIRILRHAATYLENTDTDEALDVLKRLEEQDPIYLPYAFHASKRRLTPAELYDQYVGSGWGRLKTVVSKKSQRAQKALLDTLRDELYSYQGYVRIRLPQEQIEAEWDPRWLDWLIERDDLQLVSALAAPGNPRLLPYIERTMEKANHHEAHYIFTSLDACDADGDTKFELLMKWMERKDWKRTYSMYEEESERLLRVPDHKAAEGADRLEALLKDVRYDSLKEKLEEIIHALRRRAASV
ncbi:hypothetical protein BBD41_28395 [Paenibacillus ihbetae]|uniref:HEAT repeat domain-containing protein n=1 Tax=Paenibacillus ihbetae TaxID=1870820 RepID=A0A1B2E895_9BACL|nr:HEAT repeat domain-containing protein [Paenibacillus ihbetae]ANY76179.1 hypothetical protein BBD41_28395 [Paenibacillus ihbetae]